MESLEELKSDKTFFAAYVENNLTKSHGDLYCCPFCGSGTHGAGSDGALGTFIATHAGKVARLSI